MILQIQPNFHCENCIKCGKRPQVEELKKSWVIACPDKNCKNLVKGATADFATWNRLNKKPTTIAADKKPEKLKQTA